MKENDDDDNINDSVNNCDNDGDDNDDDEEEDDLSDASVSILPQPLDRPGVYLGLGLYVKSDPSVKIHEEFRSLFKPIHVLLNDPPSNSKYELEVNVLFHVRFWRIEWGDRDARPLNQNVSNFMLFRKKLGK